MICRNGRAKNWRLSLLSTRIVLDLVDSQAPRVSDCWINLKKRYVVTLTPLQPPNIVDRAKISIMELNEMNLRIEEHQKKIDNNEMLATAGIQIKEELWQLKFESQSLSDQLLETKQLLEYAGNHRESCRTQIEILKKELVEVTNVAETKTRECIALVDERECLARNLENAEIGIRKLRTRVRTEQILKKVIRRRLEAINAQSPFSRPPNFYELLFLPQGATTSAIHKHFKCWRCSVIRTRVVAGTFSKFFFSQKKI